MHAMLRAILSTRDRGLSSATATDARLLALALEGLAAPFPRHARLGAMSVQLICDDQDLPMDTVRMMKTPMKKQWRAVGAKRTVVVGEVQTAEQMDIAPGARERDRTVRLGLFDAHLANAIDLLLQRTKTFGVEGEYLEELEVLQGHRQDP